MANVLLNERAQLIYSIRRGTPPRFSGQIALGDAVWQAPIWNRAESAVISQFHAASSGHRPVTIARLIHDAEAIHLRFDVDDRYVIARATTNQQSVCLDSCVEFFVQPFAEGGYFNFEFNCGGTVLASYVTDPTRTPTGLAKCEMLDEASLAELAIAHSMPKRIDPELITPTAWRVSCRIPLAIMEKHVGPLKISAGQQWRANFYKCADHSSHPHWASWAPIGEHLNFHQPERFGQLIFF